MLDRLLQLAVHFVGNDLGSRDRELVAFAAQRLDQDGQVQLTAAGDQEFVGAVGVPDTHADVGLQLAQEPAAQLARGAGKLGLAAGEWRRVHAERHPHRWFFNGLRRQRLGHGWIGHGVADRDVGDTGQSDDVPDLGALDRSARETCIGIDGDDLERAGLLARPTEPHDAVAWPHGAATDAADGKAALVTVVVQRGDLDLQWTARVASRRRDVIEDGIEQRLQIAGQVVRGVPGTTFAGDGVQHRKLELCGVGGQVQKQI